MIPTAIVAGFVLGIWLRWWAIPIVAAGWAIVIAFLDPSAVPPAALLGAANGLVGVLPSLAVRRIVLR